MSAPEKISLESFAEQCKDQIVPLDNVFGYFCAFPVEQQAIKKLLQEPVAAVPPEVGKLLERVGVLVVPFLEKGRAQGEDNGDLAEDSRRRSARAPHCTVTFQRPPARKQIFSSTLQRPDAAYVFLAAKNEELSDCHYSFYSALANLLCNQLERMSWKGFLELVREELKSQVRGEIDERSWLLKEKLVRRQGDPSRDTKLLRSYARQALQDTLTLYMHGLCCDIDLEAGPRQLNSRNIRRRLNLLRETLPPPPGFALFPEELDRRH